MLGLVTLVRLYECAQLELIVFWFLLLLYLFTGYNSGTATLYTLLVSQMIKSLIFGILL